MGVTEAGGEGRAALEIIDRNGQPVQVADGWRSPDGRVWGTYLHGLFDNDGFRHAFLGELAQEHRIAPAEAPAWSFRTFQETQLDRLADLLRSHLDMALIWKLIKR
jgi:adenosylcobyric acid synthase